VPLILDFRDLDVETAFARAFDARAHAIRREDRVELGQIDRARRRSAIARAIGETSDAGSPGDERIASHRKPRGCHRAHRVPDEEDARAVDGHVARDFIDEALEELRADAEWDRRRRDQRELTLIGELRQRAVAVSIEEHVLVAARAMERHHEGKRSITFRAVLSRRQVDPERSVDAPEFTAPSVRTPTRLGVGQFLLDGRGERRDVGEE